MQYLANVLDVSMSTLIANSVAEYIHQVTDEKDGKPSVDMEIAGLHTPKRNLRRKSVKDGELIHEKPEEELEQGTPLPSNLVEVETPSETWKTEFKNEISSLRINGEDVSKIHRAMEELRKMYDSSDRKLRSSSF